VHYLIERHALFLLTNRCVNVKHDNSASSRTTTSWNGCHCHTNRACVSVAAIRRLGIVLPGSVTVNNFYMTTGESTTCPARYSANFASAVYWNYLISPSQYRFRTIQGILRLVYFASAFQKHHFRILALFWILESNIAPVLVNSYFLTVAHH